MVHQSLEWYRSIFEGWVLLAIVAFGLLSNGFLLSTVSNQELNLIRNFRKLLQMQSVYDMFYLVCNVIFVVPAIKESLMDSQRFLQASTVILPFMQIFLTCSTYTTLALAFERLEAMSVPNIGRLQARGGRNAESVRESTTLGKYPVLKTGIIILATSCILNSPRFFELKVASHIETSIKLVNNTGIPLLDNALVRREAFHLEPTDLLANTTYYIGYNQSFNFLTQVFVPSLSLIVLNVMIFRKLKAFSQVSRRLGREERKTVRATWSLIAIVVIFIICHSIKIIVNGFQLIQVLSWGSMVPTWPQWVEISTIISHILLAVNSSVNLLLYCICDRHFWVIASKNIKLCFVWPFTLRKQFVSLESVETSNREVQTTEL